MGSRDGGGHIGVRLREQQRRRGCAVRRTRCAMRIIVVVVGTSLFRTAVVAAHPSSSAEFDLDKQIRLTGVVTKLEWTNPHAWFYIDVKDESGKVTNWGWELGSPNGLLRTGWNRNSLK